MSKAIRMGVIAALVATSGAAFAGEGRATPSQDRAEIYVSHLRGSSSTLAKPRIIDSAEAAPNADREREDLAGIYRLRLAGTSPSFAEPQGTNPLEVAGSTVGSQEGYAEVYLGRLVGTSRYALAVEPGAASGEPGQVTTGDAPARSH